MLPVYFDKAISLKILAQIHHRSFSTRPDPYCSLLRHPLAAKHRLRHRTLPPLLPLPPALSSNRELEISQPSLVLTWLQYAILSNANRFWLEMGLIICLAEYIDYSYLKLPTP
ncbi:hypothetical protein M5K25_006262 [Dendrobium thyrsiflorum]|uniref:Uncharacterized protein n=1 Tax=Dendrobium thyrsiflorum TaxID=117978 RepID=A0ABD0VB59_DENTH